jgi:Xaa-Pro aminopeptidase
MSPKEYERRRRGLMSMIGANGIAVLAAAPERVRSRDTLFVYRPDSDFYYLTGFAEPEAVAVLVPGRPQGEYLLFCRERNPERELWDGPRAGPEGAVAEFGADDAFPISDLDDILPGLLERSDRVYYSIGANEFDQRLLAFIQTLNSKRQSGHSPSELVALDHLLHEMRLFKSRGESTAMRRSARVAVAAHARAMQAVRPGMMEYELEAEFLHEFRRACCTTARTTRSSRTATSCSSTRGASSRCTRRTSRARFR